MCCMQNILHANNRPRSPFSLDSTPTHSYMKALYKYTQAEYPYANLAEVNRTRGRADPEYELEDTGVLEQGVWDVQAEYAKADDNDLVIRFTITNNGPETATITAIPTLWFRNTWVWGGRHEGCTRKPCIRDVPVEGGHHYRSVSTEHETLEPFMLYAGFPTVDGVEQEPPSEPIFTDNETNFQKLFGNHNTSAHTKDAFEAYIVRDEKEAISGHPDGTKAGFVYRLTLEPGKSGVIRLRMRW